jgi:uncharacterized protein YdeI (YjbR/CyaY-like superfamily)
MDLEGIEPLFFRDASEWREWLSRNGRTSSGEWVKIFKAGSKKEGVRLGEAVEEALCFGWIDSVMKSIDDDHYILRFTPRRKGSVWSENNLVRMRKLMEEGRMTQSGLDVLEVPVDELPEKVSARSRTVDIPSFIEEVLKEDQKAWDHFGKYPPSHKRMIIGWIMDAKRPETRERRLREAIRLFSQGKHLGMK